MTKALFSKLMAAILACAVFTLVLFSCSMTANAAVQRMSLQEESFIRLYAGNFSKWTGSVSASVTPPAAVCNGTCPPARKAPLYAAQHISEAII